MSTIPKDLGGYLPLSRSGNRDQELEQINNAFASLVSYVIAGDSASISWGDILNKPTEFPAESHTHPISDITSTGTPSDTTFLRGDGVWATPSGSGTDLDYILGTITGTVTSSTGTDATIPEASGTNAGLMTAGNWNKLDGIETGAEKNIAYTAGTGLSLVGSEFSVDNPFVGTNLGYTMGSITGEITSNTGTNATIFEASTSTAGLMTANDKTKLNGIASNANNYSHPTHPGDDINVDTGALSGATVISDLDFNITTDTLGHVTDANAVIATRNLTAADVGAATSAHNHNGDTIYPNTIYVGDNGSSDSNVFFYDDNSNTWRTFQWDDSVNNWRVEDNGGTMRRLFHEGHPPTWGEVSGKPTTFAPSNHTHSYLPLSGGTVTGNLTVTGSGTASDWIATSDIRLKDNIAPLNINDCLNQINQLIPSSFTWKESGESDTGLIAQQVQEILPERVKGDDQLAVSYAKITTHLIGAVQALTKRVEELEGKLNGTS